MHLSNLKSNMYHIKEACLFGVAHFVVAGPFWSRSFWHKFHAIYYFLQFFYL